MGYNIANIGTAFTAGVARDMLVQPEAQFFFAQMSYAAQAGFQLETAGMPWGMDVSRMGGVGQTQYPEEIWQLMIASASPLASAISYREEPGKTVGGKIKVNRPVHSVGGLDLETRTMKPTKPISKSSSQRKEEQAEITLVETAGPIAAGETEVTPLELNRFPAGLSNTDLRRLTAYHLHYDRTAWLDSVVGSLFDRAVTNVMYPFGISADDDVTAANGALFGWDLLVRIEQRCQETSIPPFANGHWALGLTSGSLASLKMSPEYNSLGEAHPTKNPLFEGSGGAFVKTVGKLDLYAIERLKSSVNGSGITLDRNICFGRGAVGLAQGEPVRVGYSEDTDHQRSAKVTWHGTEGFQVFDERFLINIRTTPLS